MAKKLPALPKIRGRVTIEMPHEDAYRQIIADGVEVVVARYGVKMRLGHKNTGVGVAADTCIITRNVGRILFR